jgi:carbonic anhydrase
VHGRTGCAFRTNDPILPDMHRWAARLTRVGFVVFMGLWGTAGAGAAGARPEAALERLRAGNDRFVRALMTDAGVRAGRRQPAETPSAVVLSCADPGAAPEQIFDSAPGDLVSVRVAGPVADRVVIASVEDAVERLKTPVLVVMGHDTCATVRRVAAADGARARGSDVIADALAPALARAASRAEIETRLAATQAAVEQTVNDLLRASDRLRQRVKSGDLLVAGAYYEAETGRVVFSRRVERVPGAVTPVHGTR